MCQQEEKQLQGLSSILNSFTVLLEKIYMGRTQLRIWKGGELLSCKSITIKRAITLRTWLLPNLITTLGTLIQRFFPLWVPPPFPFSLGTTRDLIWAGDHQSPALESVSVSGISPVRCDKYGMCEHVQDTLLPLNRSNHSHFGPYWGRQLNVSSSNTGTLGAYYSRARPGRVVLRFLLIAFIRYVCLKSDMGNCILFILVDFSTVFDTRPLQHDNGSGGFL